ncbi:hypothetical protein DL98DRAFT_517842 [Cadophora sp. DSE1049]|nr:hypothetical protein DL98DRAFT_517842 [Cadophora sp. DSE1049]
MLRQPTAKANHALQDYQMQLMLLEQQNKKRRMMAQQEKDNRVHLMSGDVAPSANPPSSLSSAIDARNRADELSLSIRENSNWPGSSSEDPQPPNLVPADSLLQDCHEQEALIRQKQQEQQANDRLLMSKNEETADEAVNILLKLDPTRKSRYPLRTTDADKKALEDYQTSLMTLTCGNPNRRMMYPADGSTAKNQPATQVGIPIDPAAIGALAYCDSYGADGIAKVGLATAAAAAALGGSERRRGKPPVRERSRSRSRQRRHILTAGLAGAAVAELYKNDEGRRGRRYRRSELSGEANHERSRSRSRSRYRSPSADEDSYTDSEIDCYPGSGRRSRSRSRSRVRSSQKIKRYGASVAAVAAIARPQKRRTSKARASGAELAKEKAESSFQNEPASFGNEDEVMHDALVDFDFDSFLQQDESPNAFNFDPVVFADENQAQPSTSFQPPAPPSAVPYAGPIVQTTDNEDLPLFVNAKQFHRLLKRRAARQKLEEQLASRDSRSPSPDTARSRASGKSLDPSAVRSDNSSPQRDRSMQSNKGALLAPPTLLNSNLNNAKDVELAWSHPMLTPAQTSRLWWQTYISFIAASSRKSPVFSVLNTALEMELGFSTMSHVSDEDICKRVVDNIRPLSIAGSTLHEDRPELRDVLFLRGDIVRMLLTVDGRLGLETATLGWSCVCVFLNIFNKVLNPTSPLCPSALSILSTSFSQLQEIVHIIARYAVMENLYQQSITSGTSTSTTLSLKPEYQSSLLSLCSSILEWFAASYNIGKIVIGVSNGYLAGVGALPVLGELNEKVVQCGELMVVIREKNRGCQIFRVEVDVKEESGSDGENDDTDVEDVSDGSWEEIGEDDIKASVGNE